MPFSQNSRGRPNLLYLVHRLPFPPDKGDRIRTFQFLRYLSQRASVHLACLADEPIEVGSIEALSRYCAEVRVVELGRWRWVRALGTVATGRTVSEGAFSSPQLRELLRQWTLAKHFHACLVSASSLVPYLCLPELSDIPAIVDLIDVDSQKWFDYAAASFGPRAWLYRLEGRRLRQLEANLPASVRAATVVSEPEAALYRKFCADGRIRVVGNGVDLSYFQPQCHPNPQNCVFLGALDYKPNVDGVDWFCREIWPKIRVQAPRAQIFLVGRRPVPAVLRLARISGVVVVGQVPDVRPYLARAALTVVPLHIARGVQNKILEALAMAKATVISPSCLKSLGAVEGKHLLVASSPEEWTQQVVRLLADAGLREQLGQAGRNYVMEHHCWDRCLEPLDALLGLADAPVPLNGSGLMNGLASVATGADARM